MRTAARHTFTRTRTGLLLRVETYEPHNFRQLSTEQSIVSWPICPAPLILPLSLAGAPRLAP